MPVSIKGSGGGGVTLDAGAAASATTLTLPNTSGTILQSGTAVTVAQGGTGLTSPGTAGNVLTSTGSAWVSSAPSSGGSPSAIGQIPFSTDGSTYTATQKIVQGTAVASTSGTSIDFTSIPSWVKRITVMLNGVSTNGTSGMVAQIGSGSVTTTGYSSIVGVTTTSGSAGGGTATTYFYVATNISAATTLQGSMILSLLGSNTWVCQGATYSRADSANTLAGSVTLSGALDRVRITTTNGTDTFDAGSINLLWE